MNLFCLYRTSVPSSLSCLQVLMIAVKGCGASVSGSVSNSVSESEGFVASFGIFISSGKTRRCSRILEMVSSIFSRGNGERKIHSGLDSMKVRK